ncbi:MAG: PQQ-binding-like beta-propeller repeat protein [Verrucomicrobiales bacterium]|nr:PQQ-binding-like beta-propeller repeat protein [Verrucomicrobiales bacterium]
MKPVPAHRPKLQWSLCLGVSVLLMAWREGASAGDWPQFLGPNRDGVCSEPLRFEAGIEPSSLWSREVGAGFAGPVVVGDRVLLHHRRGGQEVLEAWKAQDGTSLWTLSHPATYRDDFGFDDGPRAVPTVADGRVFALGANGQLSGASLADGAPLWSVDTGKRLGAAKGFFGFACSPLVHRDLVLVALGGRPGAGIAAFEVGTGQLRWKSGDHEAGYASPVLSQFWGATQAVFLTRDGLRVMDPDTGATRCEYPWRSRQHASVNATTPLVMGEQVFLSASYGTGAILLDLRSRTPSKVWSSDEALSCHYASVVLHEGMLFGFHGRQEQGTELRCVEAQTGKVRWTKDGLGAGSVLIAGGQLLILTERGEWLAAEAKATGYKELARTQVLGSGTRAYPAIANGRWFGRDPRKLVALALQPRSAAAVKSNVP